MDKIEEKSKAPVEPKVGNEEHANAPVKPVEPKVEPIIQTVEREGVIETAAHEQSIGGHAPDVASVADRQDTGEKPKPREDKTKHKGSPIEKLVNGYPVYRPGRHPKERQIADKAPEAEESRPKVLEVVDSK